MDEIKVSQLDAVDEIRDTDVIMEISGGANKKATIQQVKDNIVKNEYGTADNSSYAQSYQNEHNVIVSPTEPTTSERVWFQKSKNVFIPTLYNNGVAIQMSNGTVSLNGDEFSLTATASDMYFGQVTQSGTAYTYQRGILIPVQPGETYYFGTTTGTNNFITNYNENKVSTGYVGTNSTSYIYTIPSGVYYVSLRFGVLNAITGTTYKIKVIFTKSDTAVPYTPYVTPSINVDGETIYTKTDNEWELLTLTSEFKNYNNNNSFRPKIKKEGNVVTIKGIISPTADITNTSAEHIMFVIPEKYRPTDMPLHQVCQASGMNKWLLIVAIGGNVTMSRYGTTEMTTAPASSWLPFTITYLV